MKPSKSNTAANITLKNISEAELSGPRLLVSKLKNELFNRKKSDIELKRASVKPKKKYRRILSVIICTAERNSIALNAINSVINQDFSSEKYEIIVVNNSREKFCGEPSGRNIKIVNEPIQGLSRARNTGADSASGEYLLYMDDDSLACENLLLNMFKAFEKHPGCAIIGGQIFLELPSPVPNVFLKGREAIWSGYTVPYKKFKEVGEQYEFPYGACFGIRHSALDSFGGFPENYGRCGSDFAGGEETALCFMAKNSRLKIGIEPSAAVRHVVTADRFTKEHIRETIRAGILTTYRLYAEGYSKCGWTSDYIDERIRIITGELARLQENKDYLAYFYKKCELDAFYEVKSMII